MALTSQIRYAFAADTSVTTGAGKDALAFGDITAKYLINGGTLTSLTTETITTLGTYQAPTSAAHIRIKELNAAEPTKGMYEIHFHDTQLATGSKLWLFLSATGAKFQALEIDLNAQTGDSYAIVNSGTHGNAAIKGYVDDIGVAGAGLTALGDARLANLDATISSRLSSAGYTAPDNATIGTIYGIVDSGTSGNVALKALIDAIDNFIDTEVAAIKAKTDNLPATPASTSDIPTAAAVADAVWDEIMAGHVAAGSAGEALAAASAAGDPWNTTLPGAYTAGKAGYIIGTYLDAAVSSADTIGPGADLVTLTITKGDATPIADADVWITTTAAYDTVYAGTRRTDAQGNVQFMLQAGDNYYLWMTKQGYTPIQGSLFTAVAD